MKMKFCNRVLKFKISGSEAGLQACPKTAQILQENLIFEIWDSMADLEACPGSTNI